LAITWLFILSIRVTLIKTLAGSMRLGNRMTVRPTRRHAPQNEL
jgi:hypothetical protein